MLFYQDYTITEYQFGRQTIRFAVSDNYSELYTSNGTETDIFQLETIKQDLNITEAEFAVDELSFTVNSLSCLKDTDKNALAFMLECKAKSRYVAVFMYAENGTPASENIMFLGKVNNAVTGEDKKWTGATFAVLINPEREYKFSALSLDLALLEECAFSGDVYDETSTRVDNIYERLKGADGDYSLIANLCAGHYIITQKYYDFGYYCNLPHMIKLYDAIHLYLMQASAMLEDLHGINVTFNLQDSTLPYKATATNYEIHYDNGQQNNGVHKIFVETGEGKLYDLHLNTVQTANEKNLYIDGRLLYANLDRPYWDEANDDTVLPKSTSYQQDRFYNERPFSFYSYGNVSALLFEIARALGCYLTTSSEVTNDGLSVNIQFVSRQNLTEAENTYIIGASDASIDTGSAEADGANAFYGKSNDLTIDGYDRIKLLPLQSLNSSPIVEAVETNASIETEKQRKASKNENSTEFSRLALTTSQTLYYMGENKDTEITVQYTDILPLNAVVDNGVVISDPRYMLTTALYIEGIITNDQIVGTPPPTTIPATAMRPIGKIFGTVDGVAMKSDDGTEGVQLADYVNIIAGRDKTYFETEYTLTVPFWSGFSKSANGSNASRSNIKLGSVIELNEKIRKYENGTWSDYTPAEGTQFVVVSKETALDKPETKLKLQNVSRFAYGTYTPTAETQVLGKYIETVMQGENIENGKIAYGQIINVGDAVSMNADGNIYKTICNTNYRGQFVGVAVQATNELIAYQSAGVVSNPYFEFIPQMPIFVRNVNDGMPNISQQYRGNYTPIINENLVIRLGYPISSTSFQLDYKEYEVQYREPH